MYCRKCRYDLQQLGGPACPECGRRFDPADPTTYDTVRSHPVLCVIVLLAGLATRAAIEGGLLKFGRDWPGTLYPGDWVPVLVAAVFAFGAGWLANMRLAFLVYGGLCGYMLGPGTFEYEKDWTGVARFGMIGGLVAATTFVVILTWTAGRLGWWTRNVFRRIADRRGGPPPWWLRPRTYVLVATPCLALVVCWVGIETGRVMYGTPRAVVDYAALIETRRAEQVDADPDAHASWERLMDTVQRLIEVRAEHDTAFMLSDFRKRATWDVGESDFYYVLAGAAIPPDADRERAIIRAVEAAGLRDDLRDAVGGRVGLRPVILTTPMMNPSLSYLMPVRSVARMLVASMRFEAADGDLDAAVETFRSLMALGAIVSHQGQMIEDIVGAAIMAMAMDELTRELQECAFDDAQCRALLDVLDRHERAPAQLVLDVERAIFLDAVQRTCTDRGDGEGHVQPDALSQYLQTAISLSVWQRLRGSYRSRFHELDRASLVRIYERAHESLSAAALMPEIERSLDDEVWLRIESVEQDPLAALAGLSTLAYYVTERRPSQRRAAIRVMIAIERFVAAEGRLPDSLADLVPAQLPEPPRDPQTDGSFGYRLLEEDPGGRAFLLYSFGPDLQDDGGRIRRHGGGATAGLDVELNPPRLDPSK